MACTRTPVFLRFLAPQNTCTLSLIGLILLLKLFPRNYDGLGTSYKHLVLVNFHTSIFHTGILFSFYIVNFYTSILFFGIYIDT